MPGLPLELRTLLDPDAYPHAVTAVRLIETHVSWVLLTGELAYKLKRPVRYPFVDLTSVERRAHCCAEELRLNRRFAPELYLGLSAVTIANGKARMDGDGAVLEHAVRMRQFDVEDGLDRLLATQRVEPGELAEFGRALAAIHATLPVAQDAVDRGTAESTNRLLRENLEQCLDLAGALGTHGEILALRAGYEALTGDAQSWFAIRRAQGHVRECHGDLHARNVVRYGGRLVAFDCLEYAEAFRWIDVAQEIAFLLMDLDVSGDALHAHAFLDGYLTASGDHAACRLLAPYACHLALVRAKVAALEFAGASAADREAVLARHRAYLAFVRRTLARERPMLLLMHGLAGSGKSWLARRLAPLLGAVHLRSDVERKRLAGLAERERSGSSLEQGLYAPGASARVYEHLAQVAGHVLAGGYPVIVDASFIRRADRDRFRKLAGELGVELCVVHCQAPKPVVAERLLERRRRGVDASEADLTVFAWQESQREPIAMDEELAVVDVETTVSGVVSEVCDAVGRLRARARSGAARP